MKNSIKFVSLAFVGVFLASCQSDEVVNENSINEGVELVLSPNIEEVNLSTYAKGNTFFEVGDLIDLEIKSTNPKKSANMTYMYDNESVFKGSPGYRFSLDDHYIEKLTAKWPRKGERSAGVATDQRSDKNFQMADWLTAITPIEGIMPTDKPVPMNFKRENSLLEFELAGQYTHGVKIQSLLIELMLSGRPVAHWAHCGDGNTAKLILEAGTRIVSTDKYLIGRLQVEGGEEYTIIFPETDLTVEAGKRYIVTLTSQGYNVYAYIRIAGWTDSDNGIAIPFQKPEPNLDGTFTINNAEQLIGMSYLMRHYTDASTFNWLSHEYIISDEFSITEEKALNYIQVPSKLFKGKILLKGESVRSVTCVGGQELELFDDEK